jgi:superfamily II DNA or RNA helicase
LSKPNTLPEKNQLVQIVGKEGYYFVVDVIDALVSTKADLKPVDSDQNDIVRVPIARLKPVAVPSRYPIDFFLRIVLQGLMPSIEGTQLGFYCNTIFKPYQFRPLLKYLENPERRILIADETGLGKTIEAGYILISELASSLLQRILILCPPSLQQKWQGELWYRFGLHFDIVSGRNLLGYLLDSTQSFQCIASFDCLRIFGDKVSHRILDENKLDLLVIDEIHHMIGRGGETLRRKSGITLSLISNRVVGLSATPVHLELFDLKRIFDVIRPGLLSNSEFEVAAVANSRLNRLYKLLSRNPWNPEDLANFQKEVKEFEMGIESTDKFGKLIDLKKHLLEATTHDSKIVDDKQKKESLRKEVRNGNTFSPLFTRTRKNEVGEDRKRIICNHIITLDTSNIEAFQEGKVVRVSEKALFEEVDNFLKSSFSAVHRHQLYSCLPAMIGLLRSGMKGFNIWVESGWEEVKATLGEQEKKRCEELASKFGLLLKDTKWEELKRTIHKLHDDKSARKIIVFTQWIPTIEYFRQKTREIGLPCFVISGEDSEQKRANTIMVFQKHEGYAVLLTTDVTSEGLDLQSADCIVNYDFPFNPQRIEQRIGRIDRVGQKSKSLTIINLLLDEPLDQEIFDILLKRVKIFEEGVGDLPDILLEKVEAGRLLDNDEVIRALRERETRQKLLENDALIGIDDSLDDEIEVARKTKAGGVHELRWMAFERLMFMILGKKLMQEAIIESDSIVLKGLNDVDLSALSRIVDIQDRAYVKEELHRELTAEGTIRISFKKDSEGLYLPYFHPLMQKAIKISYQSLFGNENLDSLECEVLLIKGDVGGILERTGYLITAEFNFEGLTTRNRKWYSWFMDSLNQDIIEVTQPILKEIWMACSSGQVEVSRIRKDAEIPLKAQATIQQHYESWIDQIRSKDRTQYLIKSKADVRKYSDLLNQLQSVPKESIESSRKKEHYETALRIKERISGLREAVRNLESGSSNCDSQTSSLRLVVVFKHE